MIQYKKFLLAFCLTFLVSSLFAQHRYFGLEIGYSGYSAKMNEDKNFRDYLSTHPYEYYSSPITGAHEIKSASLGAEWRLGKKERLTVGARWKYSEGKSSVFKSFNYNGANYFIYKLRESGTTTEYVTIDKVVQRSKFIGVPIDLRIYPFLPRRFNLFFRASLDLNVLIDYDTEVKMHEEEMKVYRSELNKKFARGDTFQSIATFSAGFNVGKPGKPKVGLEVCAPSFFLTNPSGIARPTVGGGINFFLKLPLTTKAYEGN